MKTGFNFQISKLLVAIAFLLSSGQAMAWISSNPVEKQYSFRYHMQKDSFSYSQNAATYEEAYEGAAKACYRHFKGGRRLTEDKGLDIIDVCANPRAT